MHCEHYLHYLKFSNMKAVFNQFRTKEEYFVLKNHLSSESDFKGRYNPLLTENLLLNSPILLAYYDNEGVFHEINEVSLEYLIKMQIDRLCNGYVSDISNFSSKPGVISQNISHFSSLYLNGISHFLENLSQNSIIEATIVEYLENSIYRLIDFFKGYLENPYPMIKRKLDFNLKRNEVTYLFFLLRDNNIISKDISDSQLAVILQNMIKYKSSAGEFKDIVSIKSLISDYNNPYGEKSKTHPAETLENIFNAPDFYLK